MQNNWKKIWNKIAKSGKYTYLKELLALNENKLKTTTHDQYLIKKQNSKYRFNIFLTYE
jgi:hypothetical protein